MVNFLFDFPASPEKMTVPAVKTSVNMQWIPFNFSGTKTDLPFKWST